jgi:3-hydroxyisobutyrate dehydrogenase-like beta-hydroxyacid dehydrogenase
MGTPIASFLLKADYSVTGFDILEKQMSDLLPLGLKPARSPREAAKGADLIILSLRNWDVILDVVEGSDGILTAGHKGQIVVDCSTSPPLETKTMAQRLAMKEVHWLDVPVSGSAKQARDGNLVFMAGGEKSVFDKVKPVFDKIGKKTVYVGKSGDAAMLKIVVNQVLFINQAAAIEGLTLGLKAGLDPDILYEVLISGAAQSNVIEARGRDMIAGNFEPKGALWIAIKDLALTLESAKRLGVVIPITALYQQLLLSVHNRGWDDMDATVTMRLYDELTGKTRNEAKSP